MTRIPESASRVLELLAQAPDRIRTSTRAVSWEQLSRRSKDEPWSIYDILAHLRACTDVWGGKHIYVMIEKDGPVQRHVSPLSAEVSTVAGGRRTNTCS